MAFKSFLSKWNFIRGKKRPPTGHELLQGMGPDSPTTWGEGMRGFIVDKFGAGTFVPDVFSKTKHSWFQVWIIEGSRKPNQVIKRMDEMLATVNGDRKNAQDETVKVNLFAHYKNQLHEIATRSVDKCREEEAKSKPLDNKEVKQVLGDATSSTTYKHKAYSVSETTRKLAVPVELINQMMRDPILNDLITDPESEAIQTMVDELDEQPPPDHILKARTYRSQLVKGMELTEDHKKIALRLEKAINWRLRRDEVISYLSERAMAELRHLPIPFFAIHGTQYASYLKDCVTCKVRPKPPATFWNVTFYGLRLLNPGNIVDAVLGGVCEGCSRLICAAVDKCVPNKKSTGAIALKVVLTLPFTILDSCAYIIGKLCSVSGWVDAFKTVASLGRKCGSTKVEKLPKKTDAKNQKNTTQTKQSINVSDMKKTQAVEMAELKKTSHENNTSKPKPTHSHKRSKSHRTLTAIAREVNPPQTNPKPKDNSVNIVNPQIPKRPRSENKEPLAIPKLPLDKINQSAQPEEDQQPFTARTTGPSPTARSAEQKLTTRIAGSIPTAREAKTSDNLPTTNHKRPRKIKRSSSFIDLQKRKEKLAELKALSEDVEKEHELAELNHPSARKEQLERLKFTKEEQRRISAATSTEGLYGLRNSNPSNRRSVDFDQKSSGNGSSTPLNQAKLRSFNSALFQQMPNVVEEPADSPTQAQSQAVPQSQSRGMLARHHNNKSSLYGASFQKSLISSSGNASSHALSRHPTEVKLTNKPSS